MSDDLSRPCTAFIGTARLAGGALVDVALAAKAVGHDAGQQQVLVFDDTSGAVIDLDLRGSAAEIVARLTEQHGLLVQAVKTRSRPGADEPARGRGRPKLGVVAREVTLLPRHWEWLATQSGGASQALRRLVDEARRSDGGQTQAKLASETVYRFLSALAGDLPGFEEVIRALFADDGAAFAERMATWPPDVRDHALKLARAPHVGDQP